MDCAAVAQGLATAASGIDGLNAQPFLPDSITPPIFGTTEIETAYHQTFGRGGLQALTFTAGIFTSRGDTPSGRALLVGYMAESGDTSLLAAIEADKTLGGVCKQLVVEACRGAFRLYQIGGVDYLGALWTVRVWG